MKRAAALAALAVMGCYSNTIEGTSLLVRVTVPQGLGVDQLELSANGPEGSVLTPTLRPSSPATSPLSASQSVRILLDSTLQGQTLMVDVEGLSAGTPVASAENQPSPAIVPGQEVSMEVALQPGAPDGGADGGPTLCADSATVAGPLCTGKWCWEYPFPAANTLYGAWTSVDCQVFTVGAAGTVLHKSGSVWTADYGGVLALLDSVWGSAPDDVWAVGDCGAIMHWDGFVWSAAVPASCATAPRILWTAVYGTSQSDVWAVGNNGLGQGVTAHWNGLSWGAPQVVNGAPPLMSVWLSGPSDGWAVGSAGSIWHYDGDSWTGFGSPTTVGLVNIFGLDAGDAWALGYDAGGGQAVLLRLQGQTWQLPAQPPPAEVGLPLESLWASSDDALVAVGGSATTGIASFLSGTQWTAQPAAPLRAVTGAGDGTTFAVGSGGALYRGTIGSLGVQELPLQIDPAKPATLEAVTQSGGDAWAVGSAGTVLHQRPDAGWLPYASPSGTLSVQALWQAGPGDVWAAGQSGFLAHSTSDGGWTPLITPPSPYPSWVGMSGIPGPGPDLWLVGGSFDLTHVSDAGIVQCPIQGLDAGISPATLHLYAVWSSDAGTVAVGTKGLIVSYDATSLTCSVASFGGPDLRAVWGASASDVWAAGLTETLMHGSVNGPWTVIPPPLNVSQNFYAITGEAAGSFATRVWVSGQGGGTFAYNVGTAAWSPQELLGEANDILGAASGGVGDVRLVGINTTIVHRSPP
jgi:hypothetical protein